VPGELESMSILDGFLQIRFVFKVNIEYVTALHTFSVIVIAADMIKAVSTTGELSFSNFARFG
jgi:hypothetical protein